jgi:myosin-1
MEKPFPRPITETIGEESFVHCSAHVRTCFKTMSAAEAAAAPSTHGAGVSDMVLLRKLSEKSVAKNLEERHAVDEIYTYIGHVLVAVNPFKWITAANGAVEDLYGSKMMRRYERRSRLDAPPHVYAIAEAAYRGMTGEEESQCVIISGESGAGKTEAAKQVMAYIASVSAGRKADVVVTRINRIVSRSNPLLEAFGNAMTLRNNNSSRFGKYFRLLFDRFGQPRGGTVINYLLEKSRVVKPSRGERNFHVFYQLLRGLDGATKARLGLQSATPKSLFYLSQSGVYSIANEGGTKDDAKEFTEVLAAFDTIGIDGREREAIYEVLAAVLHLGNVQIAPQKVGATDGSAPSPAGLEAAGRAAAILGVDAANLVRVLTSRRLVVEGRKMVVPLNVPQATDARDACAKALYAQLFDYLVKRINDALTAAQASGDERRGGAARGGEDDGESEEDDEELSIGVLDIYGFEVFEQVRVFVFLLFCFLFFCLCLFFSLRLLDCLHLFARAHPIVLLPLPPPPPPSSSPARSLASRTRSSSSASTL